MADITKLEFTGIGDDQLAYFNGLISLDMTEALHLPETYAIGAILPKEDEEAVYTPAGIIIFSILRETAQQKPITAEIRWLYVDEQLRRQGIASRLLARTAVSLRNAGIRELRCDLPWKRDEDALSRFFTAKGFLSAPFYGSTIIGTTGSFLSSAAPVDKETPKAKKLSDLPPDSVKRTLEQRFRATDTPNAKWYLSREADWFEPAISRVSVTNGIIGSVLLVHKNPSGTLQALLVREQTRRTAEQDGCILDALTEARSAYAFNTPFEFTCIQEEDLFYLAELFHDCNVRKLTRMVTDISKL